MHGISNMDGDRHIDWGKTSGDYAVYRPGPPVSLFERLLALNVGKAAQSLLDLGTGTGVMVQQFSRQGADVVGVDIAAEQIDMAQKLALEEGLSAEFHVTPAEQLPWRLPQFDVVTANQCWLYFDLEKITDELRRVLKPGGCLVTSHFCWLPREDKIAAASEDLILKHNPDWSAADWAGVIPDVPGWSKENYRVRETFYYDEPIPFTKETWCGRIRACRGVGASLSPGEVAAFDADHKRLLDEIAPESFTVLHRIDAHVFELK